MWMIPCLYEALIGGVVRLVVDLFPSFQVCWCIEVVEYLRYE